VCRLELVIDETTNKLAVRPFDDADRKQPAEPPRKS
jgi:hypothetical protein